MSTPTHRNGWSYLGEGLAYLCCFIGIAVACLGIGGCGYLANRSKDAGPIVIIEHRSTQ